MLFAATSFGRSPLRFTRERSAFALRVASVRTTLAFVRLEKPITLRAFLWSSSSSLVLRQVHPAESLPTLRSRYLSQSP